jgi:hypothetical protein
MSSPDERCARIPVLERAPQPLDEAYERGIGHERPLPQARMQLVLSNHTRSLLDQQHEQVERLWRQVYFDSVSSELSPPGINDERPEAHGHRQYPGLVLILPAEWPDASPLLRETTRNKEANVARLRHLLLRVFISVSPGIAAQDGALIQIWPGTQREDPAAHLPSPEDPMGVPEDTGL